MTSAQARDDIAFLSAEATTAAIRNGDFTATDAVNAYLRRIDAIDGDIKSYITVCREEALGAAADADEAIRRGDASAVGGTLFGVPMAIKDQFNTKGILTSNGSRAYADNVPSEDATVVTRLKSAGAILLGKLNLSELAMGGTADPPYGTPHNPWRHGHTPGESSSGSGAALAAHLCAASVGEDTGGSGRGPASYCNAVGLRPTFTRISRHGITPMCWFMDAASPMTKTVEDCALVLGAVAGYDPMDPTTSRRPVPDYRGMLDGDIRGMRIGRMTELCNSPDMHADVRHATDAVLDTLAGLGAEVIDVSLPLDRDRRRDFRGHRRHRGSGRPRRAHATVPRATGSGVAHSPAERLPGAGQGAEPGHESPRAAPATVRGCLPEGGCAGFTHRSVSGAPPRRFDRALRVGRRRAPAVLLPPILHGLLPIGRNARRVDSRRIHRGRTAHRRPTGRWPLHRGNHTASRLRLPGSH